MKKLTISKASFGTLSSGDRVDVYTLTNKNEIELRITNFGGIVTHLKVPDKNGVLEDVVLGFDNLASYLNEHPYFGAIIGRYGNRIAKGRVSIGEKAYTLATNNLGNHLHGGLKGFDKVLWKAEELKEPERIGLKLSYLSPDGEEGYPGNLSVEVVYTLNNDNEFGIEYNARTDQSTVLNLTNHCYFNFNGCKDDVLDHRVLLHAKTYLPVGETLIPLGEPAKVEGTPFDFTNYKSIGREIGSDHHQLKIGGGYDHCFIVDKNAEAFDFVAAVTEPESGRMMEVFSTEPAVQFYTGNWLDMEAFIGKGARIYGKHFGFCLETQHYPDSPNRPRFPSTRLDPGEAYQSRTVYKFSIMK